MKKYGLICWCMLIMLSACNYGEIEGYKDDFAPGGIVMGLVISPASKTLYVDSEFPDWQLRCIPSNAGDTTVTWSSDHPEILDIDTKTGKMSWGTPRNAEVVITATSNSNANVQAICKLTIKNSRGKYRILDFRAQLGLWVLDRNLGASAAAEGSDQKSAVGDYYEYGRNVPVANMEFGGNDGKGGGYKYPTGQEIFGGYPAYDFTWRLTGPEFVDWSIPGNTPAPPGWRLPTKADLDKIAYMCNEKNFETQKEKGAAKLLRKKLLFVRTGRLNRYNQWNGAKCHWWSSSYNADKMTVWALEVTWDGDEVNPPVVVEMNFKVLDGNWGINYEAAIPIRCVMDGTQEAE